MDEGRRRRLVRAALAVSAVSVAWALTVGAAAAAVGAATHSVALLGFGLESGIDGLASVVLLWRFGAEQRSVERSDRVENIARGAVGTVLVAVALYVGAAALRALVGGTLATGGAPSLALAALSVAVLPALSARKIHLARPLESRALRADGILTAAGAALALAVLAGQVLDHALGWSRADPAVAMVIAVAMASEGVASLRAAA